MTRQVNTKLSRRLFIFSGIGAGAGLGLGAFSTFRTLRTTPHAQFVKFIRTQLHYAAISDADLLQYYQDYRTNILKTRVPVGIKSFRQLDYYLLVPESLRERLPLPRRFRTLAEDIISTFIKSTDLLQVCAQGCTAATPVPVRYLAFYTPYEQACTYQFYKGAP